MCVCVSVCLLSGNDVVTPYTHLSYVQQQDDILSELRDLGRISNEEHKKIKLEVISEKAENEKAAKYVIILHPHR